MQFKTNYNVYKEVLGGFEKTLTKQEFADECNINKIVKRYNTTGVMPSGTRKPIYADLTQTFNYQEAVERINAIQDDFMTLPSELRAEFDNDPIAFGDFISNPDNLDKITDMGIIVPQKEATPSTDEVAEKK